MTTESKLFFDLVNGVLVSFENCGQLHSVNCDSQTHGQERFSATLETTLVSRQEFARGDVARGGDMTLFLRFFSVTLILAAITGVTLPSRAAVWESTATWDEAAEETYKQWVITNWNKDYFTAPGPLKGLILDCADVVYSLRIVFSAAHGLPFVMKDPTTLSGPMISNDMTRWDSKTPEQRLRSFIQFVGGVGSTASLPADTFPVAIGPATLGAGSIILTDKEKHHSWTIQQFSRTGIPMLLFGSRPARTLLYERNEYPSVEFVFPRGIRAETNAGFRNFRQPEDVGRPVHEAKGFSLEQYGFPANRFMATVQKRMQQIQETGQQRAVRVLAEACKGVRERVDIIQAGVQKNAQLGSTCMNATQYDDHSTPSRDQRMKDTFKDLLAAYKDSITNKSLGNSVRRQVESVLSGEASASNSSATCMIEISPGTKLTLGQVYAFSMGDKLSNNPHDTLEMRWGLQAGPTAKARSCPIY